MDKYIYTRLKMGNKNKLLYIHIDIKSCFCTSRKITPLWMAPTLL